MWKTREEMGRLGRRARATLLVAGAALALTGCGNFFVPENGGGGGGGTTSSNRVYVANGTTGTLAGFSIANSKLTAVNGSPLSLGFTPVSVVVSRNNNFVYVAGLGSIYRYTINSDGSLSTPSTGATVAAVSVAAMDISPDGQWLFGLDTISNVVDEFQIDSSTGALSVIASPSYTPASGTVIRRTVNVSPSGDLVVIALGTAGDVVFTLNTTTGSLVNSQTLAPVSTTTSDNALAIDSTSSYLYIARSGTGGGVAVYKIGAGGALSPISGSPFAAGNQPFSITLDTTGKFVYVANRQDGTISGYSIGTNAVLTALTGSPYASGSGVASLVNDQSKTYLLAGATGGTPDLSMYSFDTTNAGKLNLVTSTATDTSASGVVEIAATH